jgi:hypothetical protein
MLPELASDKIDPAQRWFDLGKTLSHQISGRDYQAARRGDGYLLRRELFDLGDYPTTPRLVERYVTDLETFSLVLAELDGRHAFDAGKKCDPEQDAEFMALLGPHSERLTKRMANRWLAGWNNAYRAN